MRIPLFIPAIITFSFLCISCNSGRSDSPPRSGARAGILEVNGVVVQPQPLDNLVRSSGTVLASESVDLVTEAAGIVDTIAFREGGHVRKNDLLLKINDDDLQAQLRKARLQIELAAEQEARQKRLYEMNGISREQFDIAANQVDILKADCDNLLASIRKREVRAPFGGIIGLRYVSAGGYVSQTTRIASVQKINPLKVDFSIPEKYAGQVSVGDPVEFTNADEGVHLRGRLYAIEPRIETATGTLQLRALCENTSEKVLPGAYVQIELRLKRITGAIMVPTEAVIPVLKGETVLVRRHGLAVAVPVNTGIRTATTVQITAGLSAGDTVITTGIMQLRPGMPVRVTIATATPSPAAADTGEGLPAQ